MKVQQGATSAIIINDKDEILFLKRSESENFMPGTWEIPGGGIDYAEEPEVGLKREIMEECGINIKIIKNLTFSSYLMGKVHRLDATYLCKAINPENLRLSSDHDEYIWIKPNKIKTLNLNNYINNIANVAIKELVNKQF